MLLAIYGLRRGEVSSLRLDDLRWEEDILLVRREKQRRAQEFPLEAATGGAILDYLREVRPSSEFREVFLCLNAPFGPLSPSSMYNIVRSRLDTLSLAVTKRGPHCLRHACANHLLNCGFSLKQIGDHLGHHSSDATRVYTKVDLNGLRQVAEIDLRGLL
jgi:integrase